MTIRPVDFSSFVSFCEKCLFFLFLCFSSSLCPLFLFFSFSLSLFFELVFAGIVDGGQKRREVTPQRACRWADAPLVSSSSGCWNKNVGRVDRPGCIRTVFDNKYDGGRAGSGVRIIVTSDLVAKRCPCAQLTRQISSIFLEPPLASQS